MWIKILLMLITSTLHACNVVWFDKAGRPGAYLSGEVKGFAMTGEDGSSITIDEIKNPVVSEAWDGASRIVSTEALKATTVKGIEAASSAATKGINLLD